MNFKRLFNLSFNVPDDIYWLVFKIYFSQFVLSEIQFKRYRELSEWNHISSGEDEMLNHMYTAISDCEMWGIIRIMAFHRCHGNTFYPDYEKLVYQFKDAMSKHPLIIDDFHSGISFHFCLDTMIKIYTLGFNRYVKEYTDYIMSRMVNHY